MGEIAAVAASFCWSLNSIQFTFAGRRVGSRVVNRVRLALAVVLLSLSHLLLRGELWPVGAELHRWGWLGVSGIVGLIVGDGALFQAFLRIGPRRSMMLMTLVPVISAVGAWMLIGETLLPLEVLAILLTVGGVAWVVSERRSPTELLDHDGRDLVLGVLLGLTGATGQALGLVAAKQGLVGDFPALSATVIRMVVAATAIWLLAAIQGEVGPTWRALKDRQARFWIAGGSFIGPYVGVWLSLVAVQAARVGIASTLMSLSPILLIPFDHWVLGQSITLRTVVGTVVALTGAGMLFLS